MYNYMYIRDIVCRIALCERVDCSEINLNFQHCLYLNGNSMVNIEYKCVFCTFEYHIYFKIFCRKDRTTVV